MGIPSAIPCTLEADSEGIGLPSGRGREGKGVPAQSVGGVVGVGASEADQFSGRSSSMRRAGHPEASFRSTSTR